MHLEGTHPRDPESAPNKLTSSSFHINCFINHLIVVSNYDTEKQEMMCTLMNFNQSISRRISQVDPRAWELYQK